MNLPSGTVTFLFMDIEGSTQLWEQHPQQMRSALARHDTLLRAAIESNNGHVFKTVGDAFYAAFATAPEGLAAALAAQRALQAEPWQKELALRVRMVLHTGTAELREGDYFGPPLNRAARLLAIGHGGQVLLSDVAHELTRDALPPSVTLKNLGEHRLRDLGRPETVFQLLHPDLPPDFPPLRSLDNPELPNNLPRQVTSFIGRDAESAQVKRLLEATQLLTLTGSGGCGKTRLALQVAADLLDRFPDGVWLVELAALTDPALVAQEVASALGLKEEAGKSLVQTLVDQLKARHLLLVLDNCEHLLSACADLADTLIHICPQITLLATSREPLSIAGETTFRIPSLSLPDRAEDSTPENLSQYEAVRLFIERASAVAPAFEVTRSNAPALAQICHRLDGIPLAIELAAARIRVLPVEQIAPRLDDRFRLLTGGSRTALPRHQTLRALIDWSYSLLTEQECLLLRRLAVFTGGWMLEAAEAICAEDGLEDWEVLDVLTSLVDKSLVVYEEQAGEARYRLLETVRQYAQDQLAESGERTRMCVRHRDYFWRFVEQRRPRKGVYLPETLWLAQLEREHDNLLAALHGCQAGEEEAEMGLRLAAAMGGFWYVRGYLSAGRAYLLAVLARDAARPPTKARFEALSWAGGIAHIQGDFVTARALNSEGLEVAQQLGDGPAMAEALVNLGHLDATQNDLPAARERGERSLALSREIDNKAGIAYSLHLLSVVAEYEQNYALARACCLESLMACRETEDRFLEAWLLHGLGFAAYKQGAFAESYSQLAESIRLFQKLAYAEGVARTLERFGGLALAQGQLERAARLCGAAEQERERLGAHLVLMDRKDYDQDVEAIRTALDAKTFAAAWAEGRAMALEQTVAYALEKPK
jgi:predicted ATPase/class 3 adenylate cyclase